MPYDQLGKLLVIMGGLVLLVGLVVLLIGRVPFLGRLPGDFTYSSGGFTCVAPIATMLLLSLLLTIIVNIVLRVMNR